MKSLYVFLVSSSVALAGMATRVSAVVTGSQPKVTWCCDTSTCFSLKITGIGPVAGGDFKSPSGDWEFDDIVRALRFGSCLELQPNAGFVEYLPRKDSVVLPWFSGVCHMKGGDYEADWSMDDVRGALRGWDIESGISYKVSNPCNPNTWRWTITCSGSGPDWMKNGCDAHGYGPGVPEPGAVWLVVVGLLGLPFVRRRGVSSRTTD